MSSRHPLKRKTVVAAALVVGSLALLLGLGALITAVPSWFRFGASSRQAKVKADLKQAFMAERAYFVEHEVYTESVEALGFSPAGSKRYRYLLSAVDDAGLQGSAVAPEPDDSGPVPDDAALLAAIPPPLRAEAGVHGRCPATCDVTLVAAGNIDTDATIDVWSISSKDRTIDGDPVAAGVPFNHLDDAHH